ncbi:MAG TPA: tyrosine-type recombinase/integrase [Pseudonocardiaceae bacterium]|nr:tyrosine-type recombinase/integrase [Pseudonocardiaceae bacterium]
MRDETPGFADAADDWCTDLRRGKAESTVHNYIDCIFQFCMFLVSINVNALDEITKTHINKFAIDMRDQGRKPSVVVLRLGRVKTWLKYLHTEKWIDTNPAENIKLDKIPDPVMEILSDDEWARLLATCEADTAKGCRDRLILLLMGDSGLRRAEVGNLDLEDYNRERHTVLVRYSKRMKTREVPIGPETEKTLKKYLRVWRPENPLAKTSNALILPWRTDARTNGRVSGAAVFIVVKARLKQAGIKKTKFGPHGLRHTSAARLKRQHAQDAPMMAMFGWQDFKTYKRYGAVANNDANISMMGELLSQH